MKRTYRTYRTPAGHWCLVLIVDDKAQVARIYTHRHDAKLAGIFWKRTGLGEDYL